MNKEDWEDLSQARELLNLADRATVGEIKRSYRGLCKQYHPDVSKINKDDDIMIRLTRAYDLLMRYCDQYRIPLTPEEAGGIEAEDWWFNRFGRDPLWGKQEK